MDTQYLIRKVETCPVCKGEKSLPNPDWQQLNMAFDAWMKERDWVCMNDEAYAEWDRRRNETFPYGEPPEEDFCGECEGAGKIEQWIDLRQAFRELDLPSKPPQKVWCSCGKSTVVRWDRENAYFSAEQGEDGLWWFSLERGGWTCDPALDHKHDRAIELPLFS